MGSTLSGVIAEMEMSLKWVKVSHKAPQGPVPQEQGFGCESQVNYENRAQHRWSLILALGPLLYCSGGANPKMVGRQEV